MGLGLTFNSTLSAGNYERAHSRPFLLPASVRTLRRIPVNSGEQRSRRIGSGLLSLAPPLKVALNSKRRLAAAAARFVNAPSQWSASDTSASQQRVHGNRQGLGSRRTKTIRLLKAFRFDGTEPLVTHTVTELKPGFELTRAQSVPSKSSIAPPLRT